MRLALDSQEKNCQRRVLLYAIPEGYPPVPPPLAHPRSRYALGCASIFKLE